MAKKKKNTFPQVPEPLAYPIVDNHTHFPLHAQPVEGDAVPDELTTIWPAEILRRMRLAGVRGAITCGCELPELEGHVRLAEDHDELFAAIAIHPNEAALHCGITEKSPDGLEHGLDPWHREYTLSQALSVVADYARSEAVVAIGETGLDYFRTGEAGREAQKEAFKMHIALAKELDLPMQIHDREAHRDVVYILLAEGAPERTIFHCFSGDGELAQILNENGWYASFAGPVSYPANGHLREGLHTIRPELMLVETDAPYLTPVPFRGHPNAAYVCAYTARFMADELGKSEEELCKQLEANTFAAYGI